ncbi:hydroxymethylglutaryl-coenzyme A reductase-domain-containing protein [Tribonema minus]|uniref:3-hydroxy-3-methylglutaryl coenzyme A reductase n=1 Tax=Tribonema minus TaxID=303371 RepID=A0A835YX65_9STRA|nr:hydroxymethylglutaryl-coenzyme A reductase-domain-containing protein [Tribonema minus]
MASKHKQQAQQPGAWAEPRKPEPLPRWEVLSVLNYFVVGVFAASLAYVAFNYRAVSSDMQAGSGSKGGGLYPILLVWCGCLAYFFGFFGVSFLDKEAMQRSPSTFGLGHLDAGLAPSSPRARRRSSSSHAAKKSHRRQHTAASSSSTDLAALSDEEVAEAVLSGAVKDHQLEPRLGDHTRAVAVRRRVFAARLGRDDALRALPHAGYDYARVFGANCEIVCGYVPLPVGIVGPLLLDGREVYVPMATTEGCLVASTNRGCKAISQGGGARSVVLKDGITRAPCLRMPDTIGAARVKQWVEAPANFARVKAAFESTTSFGRLNAVTGAVAGRNVYLRFVCAAGDAMGMNMVSKGCLAAVDLLTEAFPELELIAISGNMCTDKKPAAINWIEGRGKSVVCEARIPGRYVESTLKTTVRAIVETNVQKNLIGSALAGALGGFNAHASNVVTAVFLATGQDPAQNVEASMCMTLMEETDDGDLLVSVNMPCIEVGTVGGGTSLPAQAACLDVIGCRGASQAPDAPGANARQLAQVIAAAVLAGELSLMAALASNQLVRAHMQHNRKKQ